MKNKELLVIGGSTYDITSKIIADTVPADSNPSVIYTSCGGVGRNIAENVSNLGIHTAFITAVGDDVFSKELESSCLEAGIETDNFVKLSNASSSVYLTILDRFGEVVMAASDLKIIEDLPIELIIQKQDYINSFRSVLLDTNLTGDMLAAISKITEGGPLLYADTVSVKKSVRLIPILNRIHTLKTNRTELEALTGLEVKDIPTAKNAMEVLSETGVKRIFVTLGMKGSCVLQDGVFASIPAFPTEVTDVTGAGDSYMGAIIYGSFRGYSSKDILYLGTAASHMALKVKGAVNHQLNESELIKIYKTLKEKNNEA